MINAAGFNEFTYEDFVNETCKLLEQMAETLPVHDGGASLLSTFNEENGVWSYITAHFRVC